jgi:hypothetical protein
MAPLMSALGTVRSLCDWALVLIRLVVARLLWVLVRPFVVNGS